MTFFLILGGIALFILGRGQGLAERDQKASCDLSHARTDLAIANELLRRSRQHCKELHEDLYVANLRILHLQESNQHLVRKAVLGTSPVRE